MSIGSLGEVERLGLEAVGVAVGRGEAVCAGCHSIVINLNVCLRGLHFVDVYFGVALSGR